MEIITSLTYPLTDVHVFTFIITITWSNGNCECLEFNVGHGHVLLVVSGFACTIKFMRDKIMYSVLCTLQPRVGVQIVFVCLTVVRIFILQVEPFNLLIGWGWREPNGDLGRTLLRHSTYAVLISVLLGFYFYSRFKRWIPTFLLFNVFFYFILLYQMELAQL
jgi:hypothetical protein